MIGFPSVFTSQLLYPLSQPDPLNRCTSEKNVRNADSGFIRLKPNILCTTRTTKHHWK